MIETQRLILRLYEKQEKGNQIALFKDENVMTYVDTGVFSEEKAELLWNKLINDFYPQGINTIYGIFSKSDSHYIGHAWIRPRPAKMEDWEIGYILQANEWGKGYATEIAKGLINYGFKELDLPEVFATIDEDNHGSIKVAEKAGMSFLNYEYDEDGRFSLYSAKKVEESIS